MATTPETSGQSLLEKSTIRRHKRKERAKPMRMGMRRNEISSSISLLLPLAFVSSYYLLRATLQVAGTGEPALVIADHRQQWQQRQLQQIGHPLQVHGRRHSTRQLGPERALLELPLFAPATLPAGRPLEPLPTAERLYSSRHGGEYGLALAGSREQQPLSGSIFLEKVFHRLMSHRGNTCTHAPIRQNKTKHNTTQRNAPEQQTLRPDWSLCRRSTGTPRAPTCVCSARHTPLRSAAIWQLRRALPVTRPRR